MPDTAGARGLLAKNSEIRDEMLRRKDYSSSVAFLIEGKEEYQETFNSDSKLYDIGAERYMSQMSLNAYINKDRYLGQKYITPSLTEFYGSNPQITGNIGYFDIYKAHNGFYQRENGRIVDDYNDGVHFINVEGNDLKGEQFYYLNRSLNLADKLVFNKISDNEEDKVLGKRYYSSSWVNDTDELALFSEYFFGVDKAKNVVSVSRKQLNPTATVEDVLHQLTSVTANDTERINTKTILNVTQSLFEANRIRTPENTQSKNLTNKKGEYSRSWSRHRAYNETVKNFAGNFKNQDGSLYTIEEIQENYGSFRPDEKQTYLSNNTVLDKTGFVNIVRRPENKDSEGNIKKCMFSIENLAWKDVVKKDEYLQKEQIGPNGGRIMWFPPYDISFDESVNVNWNPNTFIGRGEKVYTYTDTERNATLSFLLLIDHPNIINEAVKGVTDIDEDILRFFNGEQLLDVKKQETLYEDIQTSLGATGGEKETFKQDKSKIEFSIYFPNNYSGMYFYDDDEQLDDKKFKRNYREYLDVDWWIYLLIGRNTYVGTWNQDGWEGKPVYPSDWRGYDIAADKGLTQITGDDEEDKPISPIINNNFLKAWHMPSPEIILDTSDSGDTGATFEKYYYRVDYDMRQRFNSVKQYRDLAEGFMLNNYVVPTTANENDSDGVHFSSAEAITAIASHTKKGNEKYQKLVDYVTGGAGGSSLNVQEIIDKINKLEIENIEIVGSVCSKEGSNIANAQVLAERRVLAVQYFLETQLRDKKIPHFAINVKGNGTEVVSEDVNSEEQKRARRVDVIINFKAQDIDKLSDTAVGAVTGGDTGATGNTNTNITDNPGDTTSDNTTKDTSDGSTEDGEPTVIPTPVRRYETEADYFNTIKDNDPMVYEKITEKLKYFNPAFHSMSPEGFNARLTFIQQCTRQGHTIENSDKNGFAQTAGNLAFGRMPVCVLTLGDFINTRVLINSVTISYSDDGMQWDLNKTGVGVQPMFAKVSLQMHILGGQSLQGPISRLQNAVSFNYYANTGVYDDRADRAFIKEENGSYVEDYKKGPWAPYPDKN